MAEQLIRFINGVEYNGSNGAAIVAEIPPQVVSDNDISLISDSGGILVLGYYDGAGPNSETYETGDWVTWPGSLGRETSSSVLGYIKRSDLPS